MIKKIFLFIVLIGCLPVSAQVAEDAVVMTVGEKKILLSEFLYVSQKNGEVDFSDQDAVRKYVDMFANFKLKVAEAEANKLDEANDFVREYNEYRTQLVRSYLGDKEKEEVYLRRQYEKENIVYVISQVRYGFASMSLPKDTLKIYEKARQFAERAEGGDFDKMGAEEALQIGDAPIRHTERRSMFATQMPLAVERVVDGMTEGAVSDPIRGENGYYVVKLHKKNANPGRVQVAHLLLAYDDTQAKAKDEARATAEKVRDLARSGSDFEALVKEYSTDSVSAHNGRYVKTFAPSEVLYSFEEAAFGLSAPGEISEVVETNGAFHVIKLIERKQRLAFEEDRSRLIRQTERSERANEFAQSFVERMKGECNHVYYPDVYAKLEALCNEYHPIDKQFFEKSREIKEPLMQIGGTDIQAYEFVYYLQQYVRSNNELSTAYLKDAYRQFDENRLLRYTITNLGQNHPDYRFVVQEYRDGILLFEISNKEVWSKPAAEQAAAEEAWLKRLRETYTVEVDWDLLKNLKN